MDTTKPLPVYKHFDQETLDLQYNNRAAVGDFKQFVDRWTKESIDYTLNTRCHLNIRYGSNQREVLDIFLPDDHDGLARVMIFFHGGYWQGMHKSVFSFIAKSFTEQGFVAVLPNYPLAPDVSVMQIVKSCRKAIAWLSYNADRYGGNPRLLHLAGHSAGGHLVAMLLATEWNDYGADVQQSIYSACSLSGLFELEPIRLTYLNEKLHLKKEDVPAVSPLYLHPTSKIPFLAAVGGLESAEYHDQSESFAKAWALQGAQTDAMIVPGVNHFSILDAFCDQQSALRKKLMEMVRLAYNGR
jgi:arylformamidase